MQMSSSASTTSSSTSSSRHLPSQTELALVQALLANDKSKLSFKQLCDSDLELYGAKGSALRRQVQRRRAYLKRNPPALTKAVKEAILLNKRTNDNNDCTVDVPNTITATSSTSHSPVASASPCRVPKQQRTAKFFSPPQRPIPTSNIFSPPTQTIPTTNMTDNIQTFKFFPGCPWLGYCNGVFCVKGLEYEDPDTHEVMDKIVIIVPVYDYKDVKDGRYSGRLSSTGDGFILTSPVISECFWGDAEKILNIILAGLNCDVTSKAYKKMATVLQQNRNELQDQNVENMTIQETIFKFPDGITCNNERFNLDDDKKPPKSPFKLNGSVRLCLRELGLVDSNGNKLTTFMPFLVYSMAVDGDGALTKITKKKSSDDGLVDAFNALGIKADPPGCKLGDNGMDVVMDEEGLEESSPPAEEEKTEPPTDGEPTQPTELEEANQKPLTEESNTTSTLSNSLAVPAVVTDIEDSAPVALVNVGRDKRALSPMADPLLRIMNATSNENRRKLRVVERTQLTTAEDGELKFVKGRFGMTPLLNTISKQFTKKNNNLKQADGVNPWHVDLTSNDDNITASDNSADSEE